MSAKSQDYWARKSEAFRPSVGQHQRAQQNNYKGKDDHYG
jgi:hypothetical protein